MFTLIPDEPKFTPPPAPLNTIVLLLILNVGSVEVVDTSIPITAFPFTAAGLANAADMPEILLLLIEYTELVVPPENCIPRATPRVPPADMLQIVFLVTDIVVPVAICIPIIDAAKAEALDKPDTVLPVTVNAPNVVGLHCNPIIEEVVAVEDPNSERLEIVFPLQVPTVGEAPVIPLRVPTSAADKVIEQLLIELFVIEDEIVTLPEVKQVIVPAAPVPDLEIPVTVLLLATKLFGAPQLIPVNVPEPA